MPCDPPSGPAWYSSYLNNEPMPDAMEKEKGNEYFKQKITEIVEYCPRNIELSPAVVAFAKRAVVYLKPRRFGED